MLLTKAQVAKDWQTSAEYVRQCVLKGCPLTSFEDARLWRQSHASKRPPTNPIQIARQIADEKEDDSAEARERRKKYFEDKADDARLPSGDGLQDALFTAQDAVNESARLLKEAMIEGKDSKIGTRLSVHSKALEAYFKATESVRQQQERAGALIELNVAQDIARKGYEKIISSLLRLPQNLAPRVNPHDPVIALDILTKECTMIIKDTQALYAAA